MKTMVVGLGGNAFQPPGEKWSYKELLQNVGKATKELAKISRRYRLVICHGNGPQVGELLIQQKFAGKASPKMPLHVLDAMTQGQLGYLLQNSLRNQTGKEVVTLITQVLTDRKSEAFRKPTKPIGPFYSKKLESNMVHETYGWRKVVPSPIPESIVEIESIRTLINKGIIVIACGGGGAPVVRKRGRLVGVDAVIDKDLAAQTLANMINAEVMVLLTNIDYVYADYKNGKGAIREIRARNLNKIIDRFEKGTMKPKIESCVRFIERGGSEAHIGNLYKLEQVLKGTSGTKIL